MRFHDLTVSRVTPEAAGAVAITLNVPADLREIFAFQPGQFLTLRADIGGSDRRSGRGKAPAQGRGLRWSHRSRHGVSGVTQ